MSHDRCDWLTANNDVVFRRAHARSLCFRISNDELVCSVCQDFVEVRKCEGGRMVVLFRLQTVIVCYVEKTGLFGRDDV
jgi:hypothetical protein